MQTGPPRKCCQISQKIEGVEPHPMPQLHASLGCPNRPCGGRGHAATEKKTTSAGLAGFGLEEEKDVGVYQSQG